MVDLFAASLKYSLPVYFSPLNDPMAARTDASLQSWDRLQAYVFPSFVLICSVLNKLRSSRGTVLTLVALLWLQKEWFLELWSLAVVLPVALPLRADLLGQPHVHRLHQNLHVLQLHAWRLCSDLRDTWASQGVWLVSCLCVVAPPRIGSTSIDGNAIITGILIVAIRSPILPSLKSRISFWFCMWKSVSLFLLSVDTARPVPQFLSSACLDFRTISSLGISFAPLSWSVRFALFLLLCGAL